MLLLVRARPSASDKLELTLLFRRISTNAGRGVSTLRTGLLKKHHSPVYSGRDPPELLPGEEPRAGEDPMQEPIAVESAR